MRKGGGVQQLGQALAQLHQCLADRAAGHIMQITAYAAQLAT